MTAEPYCDSAESADEGVGKEELVFYLDMGMQQKCFFFNFLLYYATI